MKHLDDRKKIIDELFIPFNEAKKLNEMGFNDPTYGYYKGHNKELSNLSYYDEDLDGYYRAPSYQQAFKFFRDNHNLTAYPVFNLYKTWEYIIQRVDPTLLLAGQSTLHVCKSERYEIAEHMAIMQLIKIVNKTK